LPRERPDLRGRCGDVGGRLHLARLGDLVEAQPGREVIVGDERRQSHVGASPGAPPGVNPAGRWDQEPVESFTARTNSRSVPLSRSGSTDGTNLPFSSTSPWSCTMLDPTHASWNTTLIGPAAAAASRCCRMRMANPFDA